MPIRDAGKLPRPAAVGYALKNVSNTIEICDDDAMDARTILRDDVLVTGGKLDAGSERLKAGRELLEHRESRSDSSRNPRAQLLKKSNPRPVAMATRTGASGSQVTSQPGTQLVLQPRRGGYCCACSLLDECSDTARRVIG